MNGVATFRALHHGRAPGDPLVLPGPWDAASARVLAGAGFPALATPSHAIADALGFQDGATPAAEMFAAVARITRAVAVPVSADVEDGYGLHPAELVERLLEAGVVGCNLEDSSGSDGLRDAGRQAAYLAAVRAAAGDRLFVNARIDSYLRGPGTLDAALDRGRRYAEAGADGVYPITAPPEHLRALADGIGLPVNALARAAGPTPAELGRLGATRVTFGPGVHARAMAALAGIAADLAGPALGR